jgi:hypothetical protein
MNTMIGGASYPGVVQDRVLAPRSVKPEAQGNAKMNKGLATKALFESYGQQPQSARPVPRIKPEADDNMRKNKGYVFIILLKPVYFLVLSRMMLFRPTWGTTSPRNCCDILPAGIGMGEVIVTIGGIMYRHGSNVTIVTIRAQVWQKKGILHRNYGTRKNVKCNVPDHVLTCSYMRDLDCSS